MIRCQVVGSGPYRFELDDGERVYLVNHLGEECNDNEKVKEDKFRKDWGEYA